MLCLPGFTPVAKLAQAVGDSEGWVGAERPRTCRSRPAASGSAACPRPSTCGARVGSMPSKPITKTRCLVRRSGLPGGCAEQESVERASPAAAASSRAHEKGIRRASSSLGGDCSRRLSHAGKRARISGMWQRQTSGSVLCPSCGSLVGVNDEQCLTCGRRNPGLLGLRRRSSASSATTWGSSTSCSGPAGRLFLASLAADVEWHPDGGDLFHPLAQHREPVPLRGEWGGARLRLRALVDRALRGLAARRRSCTSSST